ncbi:MAG: thioredoxin fold domain-containing protein [Legionellales bacterium]|nr:thioredoxin fold domain-containing protein [Legionellales bacterium]
MSTVQLTESNFDEIFDQHEIVLIAFSAAWCAPCHRFATVYEKVSQHFSDCLFTEVDVEANAQLAQDFNVRSVPTLIIIRERVAVFFQAGTLTEAALIDLIEQAKRLNMDEVHHDGQE